ncbi:EAL domain, c-di-GMP-specific phosphodiesterase class I (or its enzymatically inactive variant) [Alkalispirochaeta americana]|uniref:EAL domain, c-di-GMP-specific phosphodiesterase class I (Or its enzymatically inactive variant) n=1 Tax=Alkalispirochaeta americana TaxID=159291 RepID=A0A1N6TLC3_9SPIO|nr:EAL domain-containing protein [Alkalispirochaeta americana]SIQ53896.1 EAL domain, c-di-GMP-specific phosphodiesterase class I (or its enzymatically inactive variant) [Alkalispirochaeta americana]
MNFCLEELLESLQVDRLSAYFQPVVNLRTARIVGCEALLRPVTRDGALLAPGIVFERARQMGCLLELENSAHRVSIKAFVEEASSTREDLLLFLNFSAHLLNRGDMDPEAILSTVKRAGLDPRNVALDIVESSVDTPKELLDFVTRNRQEGFLITLDDFGTKNSNLERVALVQPQIIKIDRSIVKGVHQDPLKQAILRSVGYLAQTMGALSLAEGIETIQDLAFCAREGVQLAQGFLLGRPRPGIAALIAQGSEKLPPLLAQLQETLAADLRKARQSDLAISGEIDHLLENLKKIGASRMEPYLEKWARARETIDAVYITTDTGIQITEMVTPGNEAAEPDITKGKRDGHSGACANAPSNLASKQGNPLFSLCEKGTDHSNKEYVFGLHALDQDRYVTKPYISLATGNLCRTITQKFRSAQGQHCLLCVDLRGT